MMKTITPQMSYYVYQLNLGLNFLLVYKFCEYPVMSSFAFFLCQFAAFTQVIRRFISITT